MLQIYNKKQYKNIYYQEIFSKIDKSGKSKVYRFLSIFENI